jgi:formylglycine-generating enzyme required for sulfatase activity
MIDGERVGRTPLGVIELQPGEHRIVIQAERYQEVVTTVTMAGEGTRQRLDIELRPLWAAITVDSVPQGATLTVDGESLGRTPLTVDLLAGTHDARLSLTGYKSSRRQLTVTAEQPQTLPVVTLQPNDGNLRLESEPSEAAVVVGGEYRGETPLDLALAPDRQHEISVSKLGYETWVESLEIRSGESRTRTIALEGVFGELQIVSRPADAELLVNGESMGRADQTLSLQAVPHVIEVRREGYAPFRQALTPRPGFPQSVRAELQTLEELKASETPPVITGPQGQELRLVRPGRFRMGASRREPGRRANETLREVELTRPYYISTLEVSNRDFREFKSGHRSGKVGSHNLEIDHHPVVRITWEEAARYCNWLSEREALPAAYEIRNGRLVGTRPLSGGYRLPTEAEWAWAARFAGGRQGLKYPWGQSLPVAPQSGNYADLAASSLLEATLSGYRDGYSTTAPIDSFEPNAIGLRNMGGNVAEWVHDYYKIYPSGSTGLEQDPVGPEDGELHTIRGSSWMDSSVTELRLSYRDYGGKPRPDVGFRIARYAD